MLAEGLSLIRVIVGGSVMSVDTDVGDTIVVDVGDTIVVVVVVVTVDVVGAEVEDVAALPRGLYRISVNVGDQQCTTPVDVVYRTPHIVMV